MQRSFGLVSSFRNGNWNCLRVPNLLCLAGAYGGEMLELGWSVGGVWVGIVAEISASTGRSESTEIPRVLPENPSIYAKFTPMTSPFEFRTGPPLPPWALEAS